MKSYSLDFRQKIIETYQAEAISQRQVAQRFCVAYSFVTKLIKPFRDPQDLAPKPRSGRPRKLTAPQMERGQDLVAAQPDSTLAELCTAVETQTQVNVSQTTLSRVMHRLPLTRKKSLCPTATSSEPVQQQRVEFWEAVKDIPVKDLVFMDESGVPLGLIRLFAWALAGNRAYGSRPPRGKKVSIVAALGFEKVIGSATL